MKQANDVLGDDKCGFSCGDRAASGEFVSISADGHVALGFDCILDGWHPTEKKPDWYEDDEWPDIPADEKLKLADAMIERWQRYKRAVAGTDYNFTVINGNEPAGD